MATQDDSTPKDTSYFNDLESGAQIIRLLDHNRLLNKGMGGIFPVWFAVDIAAFQSVIDIACGPGGWAQEVAFTYPDKTVLGVDLSESMLEYAQMQARVQHLDNLQFRRMNILKPFDIENEAFDLANARLISFLTPADWPPFIQECRRILRPNGVLRLTECEWFSNGPAFERYNWMFNRALQVSGRSFSPDGRMIGITPMLAGLIQQAGFTEVKQVPVVIDFSAGSEYHDPEYRDILVFFKELQPFLIATKVASKAEIDEAYQAVEQEMYKEDFRGLLFAHTAWGRKPL